MLQKSTFTCLLWGAFFFLPVTYLSAQTWTQKGVDIDGEANGDYSGNSVSLSSDGTTMAIGAHFNAGGGTKRGHVRVYKLVSGTWMQQGGDIDGEWDNDFSGWSVSLSSDGTTVAIGAHFNNNGTYRGHVRLYKLVSGTWMQLGTDIDGEANNDQSGESVSLSSDGTTVAIGASYNAGGGTKRGHVRVYKLVSGTWTKQGGDIDGEADNDSSGRCVSLSSDGTTVAISAPFNAGGTINGGGGHVRVYKLVSGTWMQQGTDIDGGVNYAYSGQSVSLSSDGTTVAIGAPSIGRVRVYKFDGAWTKQGADINGISGDQNGLSVSLSSNGTTMAIGAPSNAAGGGANRGHVRVYKLVSGTWTQQGANINGEADGDYSGRSVSLSSDGTIVAIGASSNAGGGGPNRGHVRVYYFMPPVPSVSIATSATTICAGTSVTFTATPTNGGTTPTYQWKKGSTDVGTNSATYTTTDLTNGDIITCVMTSSLANASPTTATSTGITMMVNPILTPSVAIAVTTGSATICNGTSVTFTATPTNGGNAPTYQWLKDGSPISGETSATYTSTTLANNEAISVVLTSNEACLSTTTATSAEIVMTVNPILTPSVAIAVTTGSATTCVGTSVTFTATPTNGGSAPTYQWLKDGSPISGETSATYTSTTLANNEAISVILTSNVACPTFATATSAAIVMTVNPILTTSVTIAVTTGSATICNGTSVTFTATPTNGGDAPTYQWLKDGSPISGETSATYTSTTLANNEAISVILTSNVACPTSATATSAPIVMTVNPILTPSVSIAITTGSATTCVGSSVTFTATPTNGGNAPTYQWEKGGLPISGETSATYTSTTLANNDIITCVLTSNACTITPTATSTGITMRVGLPIVTSITGNPSVNVEATTTLACATSGGVWSSSNTAIATVDATTGVVTGVAGGTVTINYSVTNSCGTTTVTKSIDIRPATYCLTYKPVREGNYVYLHISLLASTTTFRLGDGNTQFKYKSSVLSNPVISSTVLASNVNYFGIDLSNPSVPGLPAGDSLMSFNFVFLGNTGDGLPISTTGTGTEIAVIRFNIDDATTSPNLRPYQDADAGMVIYNDNTTAPALLAQTTDCGGYDFPLNTAIAYATPAFCPSVTMASVTLTGTSGGTYSVSPAGLTLNTETGEINPSTSAVGTYSVLYNIPASNGGQALTTVTIHAVPSITTQPIATTTVCAGSVVHLSVVATGAGLTYQWQKGGVNVSGANTADYDIATSVASDAGTYTVIVGGTCAPSVISGNAVVVVNTLPTAITGTPSVNATFTTTLANTVLGGTWSSSNTAIATVNATGIVTGVHFGTATISYTVTNACGTNTVTKDVTVIRNTVQVGIKAFLQGAYSTSAGKMGDSLRSNLLVPSIEPYTGMAKFTHVGQGGGEVVDNANVLTVTGDNAIVDWVFVELRDKTTPSTVLQTRAALIQRDGDVVDMDGVSPLTFFDVIADNYHIAVRHRNHLGFRTATSTALSSTTSVLNFTDGSKTTYGTNALKSVGGVYVMYSGNGDANAAVNAVDKNAVWLLQNGQNGYLKGDYDMNGIVNAVDINAQWLGNNSKVQQLD